MRKRFISSFLSSLPIFIWIILITSIISIIGFFLFGLVPSLVDYFALVPSNVLNGKNLWTLVTHIFFHADLFHLFVNMFSLFFLGSITEAIIGKKRFFWFYLVAGIFGGIFFVLFALTGNLSGFSSVFGDINLAGVGASGALFGLLGILAVLIPQKKVFLVAGPILIIIIQILLPSWFSGAILTMLNIAISILLFVMILSLFYPRPFLRKLALQIEMPLWVAPIAAIVPLVIVSIFVQLPIGNSAHFGGLVIGLVYGIYLRLKYPKKVLLLGKYFK